MVVGEILVSIGAVTSKLTSGLNKAMSAISGFGSAVSGVLKKAAIIGAAALTGISIAGGRFEDAMTRTFAIISGGSGLAEKAMNSLTEQARYLGRETLYSSTQAAKGMQVLALAGFSVAEIVGTIGPVLETAIVGNIELAEAASITVAALKGYGLATSEATRVSDVLASAATGANVTIHSMGESLKFILPVARAAGVAFEETAAATAILGNAGFQGSMAGTSLRRAFAQMLSPAGRAKGIIKKLGITFLDTTGNIKPLNEILDDLNAAGISAGETLQLFGLRAGPAMAALLRMGGQQLRDMTERLENSGGTAHRVAEMFRTTLIGRVKDLMASLNELSITIFNSFGDPLRDAVFAIRNWTLALQQALERTGVLKAIVDGLKEGLTPLISKVKEIADAFVDWISKADPEEIKEAFRKIGETISFVFTKVIGILQKVGEILYNIINFDMSKLKESFVGLWEGIKDIFMGIGTLFLGAIVSAFAGMMPVIKSTWEPLALWMGNRLSLAITKALQLSFEGLATLFAHIPGIGKMFGMMAKGMEDTAKQLNERLKDIDLTGALAEGMEKGIPEMGRVMGEAIEKATPYFESAMGKAMGDAAEEVIAPTEEAIQKPGETIRDITDVISEMAREALATGGVEAAREIAALQGRIRMGPEAFAEPQKMRMYTPEGKMYEGTAEELKALFEASEATQDGMEAAQEAVVKAQQLSDKVKQLSEQVKKIGHNLGKGATDELTSGADHESGR